MLFSVDNPKTLKGESLGYETLILHFSPHKANGKGVNLCPYASLECIENCLNDSGMASVYPTIHKARIRKTDEFLEDRVQFTGKLIQEIFKAVKRARKKGVVLVVRLNGTSDIRWSKIKYKGWNIFQWFPEIQFYDYTKNPTIWLEARQMKNYRVTFSWSGRNTETVDNIISEGGSVAVPFQIRKGQPLPTTFRGLKVVDGDVSDLRFLDDRNVIVGLRVKGNKQKKVKNNFLIQIGG